MDNPTPKDFIGQKLLLTEESNSDPLLYILKFDKKVYGIYHIQDCCESVGLYRADISNVVGKVILEATVDVNNELPPGYADGTPESFTSTIFKFVAEDGSTGTLYFLGLSNGYYGEGVDLREVE